MIFGGRVAHEKAISFTFEARGSSTVFRQGPIEVTMNAADSYPFDRVFVTVPVNVALIR